jgi:SAM-dependent methyltransferase
VSVEAIAPTNEEAAEAWGGVLFDRWLQFRDVVTVQISPFSEEALRLHPPGDGARVLDVGCGLGDTTTRIAELVGSDGRVTGIDVGERFIETARAEAAEAGVDNVNYLVGDVQVADLGGPYDYAFSRFGTMFFANPVAALRNVRSALVPGGRLCMIVWRRKLDNEWLHRGERVVEQFLERPDETDEPTCGPGPFSMANADTTTDILVHSGFEEVALHRHDIDYRMGDDLDKAIDLVTAIGPAGELIRLATADADEAAAAKARELRPKVEAALREAYSELATEDGTRAQASAWIVTARAPADDA